VEKGDGGWAKVSLFCSFSLFCSIGLFGDDADFFSSCCRARQSSTPASEPAVRSRAWAGLASAGGRCRRFGLLCTRSERSGELIERFDQECESERLIATNWETACDLRERDTERFSDIHLGDFGCEIYWHALDLVWL
jgi:hypothetical protein